MVDTDATTGVNTWNSRQWRASTMKSEPMVPSNSGAIPSEMLDVSNSARPAPASRNWSGGSLLSKVTAPFAWSKGGKKGEGGRLSMFTPMSNSLKLSNTGGKESKATIFATDLYSDNLIMTRISQLAENELVSNLELEEVIVRKNVEIFEALGKLLQKDRIWTRIKFRDSMNIGKYFEYKSMKTSLISHLDVAKDEPISIQAKVRFFKNMGSTIILDSLQELLSDDSIKQLVLSGDLIGSDASDAKAWKKFEDMLYSERWDRLNINLFYDMNESHAATSRPWIGHLERTLRSLEERFSGQTRLAGLNILPGNTEWADFLDELSSSDFDSQSGSSRRESLRRSHTDPCLQAFSELDDVPEDDNFQESSKKEFAEETGAEAAAAVGSRTRRRSSSFDQSKSKTSAAEVRGQMAKARHRRAAKKSPVARKGAKQNSEKNADDATVGKNKGKVKSKGEKKKVPKSKSMSCSDPNLKTPKNLAVSTKSRIPRAKSHHIRRKKGDETAASTVDSLKISSKDGKGKDKERRPGRSAGRVKLANVKPRSRTPVKVRLARSKSPAAAPNKTKRSKSPARKRSPKRSPKRSRSSKSPTPNQSKRTDAEAE